MSWRGQTGGITAAQAGHDVVMAPTSHTYFDYYQGPNRDNCGASTLPKPPRKAGDNRNCHWEFRVPFGDCRGNQTVATYSQLITFSTKSSGR